MTRPLRLIGLILAGIAAAAVVLIGVIYVVTNRRLEKVYTFNDPPLPIPTDSISIEKGRHFTTAIAKCAACHGDNFAGKISANNILLGHFYSANITRGKGGVGASYTDADYVRAIRHGVGRDGKPLIAMPTDAFYYINDEDLANTIAYLKTIPPVDAVIPPKRVGPLSRALYLTTDFPLIAAEMVPTTGPRPPVVARGRTREYGDYLATTGACKSCHLQDLSGGVPIEKNVLSANLTPTGIGKWSEADFTKSLRGGIRPDGRVLSAVMPWPYTRFMTDDEVHALWLYVRSVPPRNARGH